MKKNLLAALMLILSLTLDVLSKNLVVKYLDLYDRIDFLGGFVRITLVYNEGGVFGIMQGYKNLFLVISVVVLIIMIVYYITEKNKTTVFCISMALIVSGAIGNIIDRLISNRPGVVDFISIGVDGVYRWPSFNVADIVIIVGAFFLIITFYKEEKKRNSAEKNDITPQ